MPTANAGIIEDQLLDEIPVFENFLHKIGFKRNEGAIYGLLVLSERPLTSEEIERVLGLSQSAVSQGLKCLTLYGAVETRETRDPLRRVKEHSAKEDSLAIVASVFRKREQETIEEFKKMAKRIQAYSNQEAEGPRKRRINSIVSTCEIAESVMNFVISLAGVGQGAIYDEVVQNLPKVLEMLTQSTDGLNQMGNLALGLTGNLTKRGSQFIHKKLKDNLLRMAGDSSGEDHYE
ncbi:MAG: ArsR family transcriptional regulator [Bacteriovoracaceae bacterium]|nr:ArsR family transcriptional regulator [Bacteriovoracaceae bacterium]